MSRCVEKKKKEKCQLFFFFFFFFFFRFFFFFFFQSLANSVRDALIADKVRESHHQPIGF
jgi:hypothetical protein